MSFQSGHISAMRAFCLRFAIPLALWLWLFWHLHDEWVLNSQYNYGWAVPFIAAFLLYQRWPDRPGPAPQQSGFRLAQFATFGLLALLLPLRIIEDANPDWRLLSWSLALVVVAISLLTVWRVGGRGWTRHFAFPICFPLVAVPWLVQIENVVIHGLTRAVAFMAVEVAGILGIAALQRGNVIELANGFVGVDEACSGVKTLQAAIMVALFLGELLRLTTRRRALLLALGCAWVFACNILRATTLVLIAAAKGIPALHAWHDTIGTAVLVLGFAGLVLLAYRLNSGRGSEVVAATENLEASAQMTRAEIFAAALWLLLVFGLSETWYRAHERQLIARKTWAANWSRMPGAQTVPISDATTAILRFNSATSAAWLGADREQSWGFYARWNPGRTALQLVRSHSPEICLPATGRTFLGERPPAHVPSAAGEFAFRAYEFRQEDQPLFVFVCIQDDKQKAQSGPAISDWSARGRLQAAWSGRRNLGQRLLEIAILGAPDSAEANRQLSEVVRTVVEPLPAQAKD